MAFTLSLSPCPPFPMKVAAEPRLSPCRRGALRSIDGLSAARIDLFEFLPQGLEVIKHHAVLDDGVRLRHFVEVAGVIAINCTRVDAAVDAQQSHADACVVGIGQRPETTVRIAVFGTNTGMHDECSQRRY